MVQINQTIQAKNDLRNIADYIPKDSKEYAKLQVLKLKQRVKILDRQAYVGKTVIEINNQNIRELIEGNYRIIYRIVNDNRINVLTVHHSARDLTRRKLQV